MNVTAYEIAQRFVGIKEVAGSKHNPFVMSFLTLDQSWPDSDEVPWCSGFANYVAWLLRLPRSKSLAARSWLTVGSSIQLNDARVGFDIVVLTRAGAPQDPEVLDAPGHVGFFGGIEGDKVLVLGGNQGNSVSLQRFKVTDILGIRRLTMDDL